VKRFENVLLMEGKNSTSVIKALKKKTKPKRKEEKYRGAIKLKDPST